MELNFNKGRVDIIIYLIVLIGILSTNLRHIKRHEISFQLKVAREHKLMLKNTKINKNNK